MKLSCTEKPRRNGSRFLAAALMIVLWIWVHALEISPELHKFLHGDAQSPAHNCLVTQLQHHSVHPGCALAVLALAPMDWRPLAAQQQFVSPVSFDYRLSPSRAPPSV